MIAYRRGVLSGVVQQRLDSKKGAMLAVGLTPDEAQQYLKRLPAESAIIACYNSPSILTISGDAEAIAELEQILQADGKFARRLRVSVAYHSSHMSVVADDYRRSTGKMNPPPRPDTDILMFSSVTGALLPAERVNADYWVQNMMQPVLFTQAVTALLDYGPSTPDGSKNPLAYSALIEIGPHEALKGPLQQILAASESPIAQPMNYVSLLRRGQNAEKTALEAMASLWAQGHPVDVMKVNELEDKRPFLKSLVDLPSYPWNHENGFWHEPMISRGKRLQKYPRTDLLGAPVHDHNPLEPCWRNFLCTRENPWLQDHVIQDTMLFPAAGMLVMVIEAANQIAQERGIRAEGFKLRNLTFEKGLVVPAGDQVVETRLNVRPSQFNEESAPSYEFSIYSVGKEQIWLRHCTGSFRIIANDTLVCTLAGEERTRETTQLRKQHSELLRESTSIEVDNFYNRLEAAGMQYGKSFRNLTTAGVNLAESSAHGTITIPDTQKLMPNHFQYAHVIHPATLDSIFHLLFAGFAGTGGLKEAAVPVSLEGFYISADISSQAGDHFKGFTGGCIKTAREYLGDIVLFDQDMHEPKLIIHGARIRAISGVSRRAALDPIVSVLSRTGRLCWLEDVDHWKGEKLGEDLLKADESIGNVHTEPNCYDASLSESCVIPADVTGEFAQVRLN